MNINELQQAINVFHSISTILNSQTTSTNPMIMSNVIERKEVLDESKKIYQEIKKSCKNLLNLLSDEEIEKIDLSSIMNMFGDNLKKDIVEIIKNN